MLRSPSRYLNARDLQAAATRLVWPQTGTGTVCVVAGHAGAGATTVAAALADAASRDPSADKTRGPCSVRLVDAAPPPWSGLTHATAYDTAVLNGWRRGHRGPGITVDRLHGSHEVYDLPALESPPQASGVDVVDVGVGLRELAVSPRRAELVERADITVVVARDSADALRLTEYALCELTLDRVAVVVVRGRGRCRPLLTGAGSRLREMTAAGSLIVVPQLPARLMTGVSPSPSPASLQVALLPFVASSAWPIAVAARLTGPRAPSNAGEVPGEES